MQKWIAMLFIGLSLGVGLWRLILWMDVTRPRCSADHPCPNKFCRFCKTQEPVPELTNSMFSNDREAK